MDHSRVWVPGVVAAFCLATAVCWVSNNLAPRVAHRDETVSQQRALLNRSPLMFDGQPADVPEFRNRILFPITMIAVARSTGITDRRAFLATRWVSAFICFAVLWAFATWGTQAPPPYALLAGTLLAVFFVLSFNHPWEHPTDFPDATVMLCGVWASVRGRFGIAALIAMLGAANRESAAFIGVVWMWSASFATTRSTARGVLEGVTLVVLSLATTTALRLVLAMPGSRIVNSIEENPVRPMIRAALGHPFMSWIMLLAAACVPVVMAIAWLWTEGSGLGRRIAFAALCIAVVSAIVGSPSELRVWTPAIAVAICAMLLLCSADGRLRHGGVALLGREQP